MATIFEPLYREGQVLSEASFRPLVVTDNAEAWREFRIIIDFYRRGGHRGDDFTGILSPKFRTKAMIAGADFIEFVRANPKADVCLINPYPAAAYFSFNVWMHGEAFHSGLTERAQALLDASGVRLDISATPRNSASTLCYSNFWAGTPTFWESYVGGVLDPIARFLESQPEHPAAAAVLAPTTHYTAAPFLPFIIERLFSTYLACNPEIQVAAHGRPYTRVMDYCQTEFEKDMVREMRPLVEGADGAGVFGPDLISMQRLLCGLYQKFVVEFFARNPHPHTGKLMSDS